MAASHSSTSNRLAGTRMARLASSMRWLARPTRCSSRRHALRRADLDHLVHPAPVDAEVERRRRHHRAQLARRHRGLDAAALLDLQRAVMQRDRQRRVVQLPQRLEHQLGLGAGVDEDDGHAGGADARHDLRCGLQPHVAGPGQPPLRQHHRQVGRRAVGHARSPRVGADIGGDRVPGARRWPTARRAAQAAARGRASRATPSANWSPRLVPASACTSSITTQARPANICGASGNDSSTARLSGVVSRMLRRARRAGGRGGWPACRRCASRC